MTFWGWMRRKLSLTDPKGWALDDTHTGRPVTFDSSMSVSAFWACVRLLAQTGGTTSLGLYRKQSDGGRVDAVDHDLYSVLHDIPNATQTAPEFWEGMIANMLVHGNAYAEKILAGGSREKVVGLEFMQPVPSEFSPTYVSPERNKNTNLLEYIVHDRGKREVMPAEKILHVRGFGFGGDAGLPILHYARQSLSTAIAADEVTGRSFRDGLKAKGFFVMPDGKTLTKEQREQAQKTLVEPFTGPGGKSLGVLEGGVSFVSTNITARDAELNFLKRLSVEEVCRFLGVPPIMVGHASEGQTMWGTGVEQLLIQFYTMGLRPLFVRIEKAVWRSLVPMAERGSLYPEFNIESLLRGDTASRLQFYTGMVDHGLMRRNEVRRKENLPDVPGGDILTVQGGMTDLAALESERTTGQQPPSRGREVGRGLRVVG